MSTMWHIFNTQTDEEGIPAPKSNDPEIAVDISNESSRGSRARMAS